MPRSYSNELCDLIRSMLSHDADQRPSVNQLLRLPFVKHNIRLFLERATIRKCGKLVIIMLTVLQLLWLLGVNKYQHVKKRVGLLNIRKLIMLVDIKV